MQYSEQINNEQLPNLGYMLDEANANGVDEVQAFTTYIEMFRLLDQDDFPYSNRRAERPREGQVDKAINLLSDDVSQDDDAAEVAEMALYGELTCRNLDPDRDKDEVDLLENL